jgi:hypothetical protein
VTLKTTLRILLMFVFLPVACTPAKTSQTVPNLVAENWQDVQIKRLCLEVQQTFPEINTGFSLPVEQALRRVFTRMGMAVVSPTGNCNGTLKVTLQGRALADEYMCFMGLACGHCYTGSDIQGNLSLDFAGKSPYSDSIHASLNPPHSISECPKTPSGAPYDYSWTRAVLSGLERLWGAPLLESAIADKDPEVQKAAIDLLGSKGTGSVPALISALKSHTTEMRTRAAHALGSLGPQAEAAVPALIDMVGSSDDPTRVAAAKALYSITGKDFGQDQAAWKAWLTNPNLGPPPFSVWNDIPIYPGAYILEEKELGFSLYYNVESSCSSVFSFYQSNMPAAGWELLETEDDGRTTKITYQKGKYEAEVYKIIEEVITLDKKICHLVIYRRER